MLQIWIEALAHIREGGNSCGEKSEREMASAYVIQLSDFGFDIGHRFGVRKSPVVEATGQEEECLGRIESNGFRLYASDKVIHLVGYATAQKRVLYFASHSPSRLRSADSEVKALRVGIRVARQCQMQSQAFGKVSDRCRAVSIDIARACVGIAVSKHVHAAECLLLASASKAGGLEPGIEQIDPFTD